MPLHRWLGTTAAMAAVAWALTRLGPGLQETVTILGAPQRAVDTAGPDALLVVLSAALAWLAWAWGAVGLVLTALSALPGLPGRVAALLVTAVLPAGARRLAAVAVGVGLTAAGPAAVLAHAAAPVPTAVREAGAVTPLLDWPERAGAPGAVTAPGAPDWPTAVEQELHRVAPGECLWDIARDRLLAGRSTGVTDAQVAAAAHAWWQANAAVIGPDPDLLRPGQLLRPPA